MDIKMMFAVAAIMPVMVFLLVSFFVLAKDAYKKGNYKEAAATVAFVVVSAVLGLLGY